MASTTTTLSGKTVPTSESGYEGRLRAPTPDVNFFRLDVLLRLLLFSATVTATVVMVTGNQSKTIVSPLLPFPITREAKFVHSPAFIVLTVLTSCLAVAKRSPSSGLLFFLMFMDVFIHLFSQYAQFMLGIMASATGSAGSIAYVGLKGNSHVQWNKICNIYGKFCRHIGSSVGISLVASIALVMLVILSGYSLYRRIH
ncbi:hypothetical protein QJS04_geneDACA020138 [Acorus gramineus]|uniref:CASP-like protein n=1 Tax=Acorus gramineus TaxID=55184 RepID=A0AAV9BMK3_ACOGR|nr:hypothetical protein QJS04_geneDACA020138 [Acorus gramineus]